MLCYSDTDTVVGLPRPIHESIKTLKQVWLFCPDHLKPLCHVERVRDWTYVFFQHKYVSIAEIQVTREEEFQKTPLSGVSEDCETVAGIESRLATSTTPDTCLWGLKSVKSNHLNLRHWNTWNCHLSMIFKHPKNLSLLLLFQTYITFSLVLNCF